MKPSATQRLDRGLWYTISLFLAILVFASFIRITSFDAFIELKSSALRFDFANAGQEEPVANFGAGATIIDVHGELEGATITRKDLMGAHLNEISVLSPGAGMRLEALGHKQNAAGICLQQGSYFISVRARNGQRNEFKVDVNPDAEWCVDAVINEDFLVRPGKVIVEPRIDRHGVEIYPDMDGMLRIQNTGKELAFISGMTLHLSLVDKPYTSIAFTDGQFGIHAWKKIEVQWSDRSDRNRLVDYYYTPLDNLKKYAEDNGLWFSISLMIGIVFGIRKLLLLR